MKKLIYILCILFTNILVASDTIPLLIRTPDMLQVISKSGNVITMSKGGGTVNLSTTSPSEGQVLKFTSGEWTAGLDNTGGGGGGGDPQTISTSGEAGNITLSDGGGSLSLNVFDGDSSITNELQVISTSGAAGNITLSNSGGTLNLNVNDADASTTNEIQTISKSGNTVSLNLSGGTFDISTTSPSDGQVLKWASGAWTAGTDNTSGGGGGDPQTISTNGAAGNITLSDGGGTLNLNVNDADASPTNEIELPSQSTHSGKFLTTNGTSPSWATVAGDGVGVSSIATGNGITGGTITSTGTLGLTGQALAIHNLGTNGIISRTGGAAFASRTITASTGISISNGDGVVGNPTITNTGDLSNINEIQTISKSGNTVSLNLSGGTFDISTTSPSDGQVLKWASGAWTAGTDNTSGGGGGDPQTISTNGAAGNITLSDGGGTLNLNVNDADASPTNEIELPSQSTHSGKFLTTNGTSPSWATVAGDGVGVSSIATGNGITGGTITSTGTLGLTGQALAIHNLGTNGIISRTGGAAFASRTITASTGISISNGDGVVGNPTITNTGDLSNSNELQTISTSGAAGNITLSNSGGTLNLNINDADASPTNEIQTISKSGNTVSLNLSGGTFDISTTSPSDGQVLKWASGAWTAGTDNTSGGGGGDPQTISTNGAAGNITLSDGGGTLNLNVNDADASTTNEIQTISKSGNTVTLNLSGGTFNVSTDTPAPNEVLTWDGSGWAASANDGVGVSSIATGNGITGGTITSTGTLGLTGQALALHNLATNGMIARTGASTVASRTITASTGISVANGDGVAGNPTITNTGDLSNSNELQTISTSGTAGNITLSDGGGTLNLNVNDADASTTNEIQTISKSGNTVTLNLSGGTFNVSTDTPAPNEVLTWDGSGWAASANDGVGVSSIATGNGITGGTITSTGTLGLTGQALALHNLATNGMIARTGASTVASRTITASTGISVANGDGVAGNPTITNTGDLSNSNELQTISTSGTAGNITLSNSGGTLNLNINDADASPTNELATNFNISGNTINYTDAGGAYNRTIPNIGTTNLSVPAGTPRILDLGAVSDFQVESSTDRSVFSIGNIGGEHLLGIVENSGGSHYSYLDMRDTYGAFGYDNNNMFRADDNGVKIEINGSTGVNGYVLTSGGSNTAYWAAASGAGAAVTLVDTYTSGATWSKPSGCKVVEVIAIGGGGGGGSGAYVTPIPASGGGGGGAGGFSQVSIDCASVTSTVSVSIGSGAGGGSSRSTSGQNGLTGSTGGTSSFGSYVLAGGGGGGAGGTISGSSSGGAAGLGILCDGGAGGGSSNAATTGATGSRAKFASGGGNGGAGVTGSSGGANSTATGPLLSTTGSVTRLGSGGTGGAAANPGGSGGSYGGGGGGGGAGRDNAHVQSGAGGSGSSGIVIVITHF